MYKSSSCGYSKSQILSVLRGKAQAVAYINGSGDYSNISGIIQFYTVREGVLVCAEINGLPYTDRPCHEQVFGFHIHMGTNCGGTMDDPFADAMTHFDLNGCDHPYHAGDLTPLFGNNGLALCVFLTNRFSVGEVIGRTIIIHGHPDDFTTQPSGNSGTKIACGVIRKIMGSCC